MTKQNYYRKALEVFETAEFDSAKLSWWIAKHYPSVFVKGIESLKSAPLVPKFIIRVSTQSNLEAIKELRNAVSGLGLKEARDIVVDEIPNGKYYQLPANADINRLSQFFAIR